jgi:HlyD family secretion protein
LGATSSSSVAMRKKQLFLVVLLVAGGFAGCWWYSQKGERPVSYITTVVERGPITRLVVATGTVNLVTTVQVGTYVSGPIKDLFADFNSQ